MVSDGLVMELMQFLRVKDAKAKEEISGLAESCKGELGIAGVYGDEDDPLYRQAIRLYCKAHYGYDADTERFREAYGSLRDAMALSGDYKKEGTADGSSTDLGGQNEG